MDGVFIYLIDVTSQPLATANLQILEPRKPFPPQTTIFFAMAFDIVMVMGCVEYEQFGTDFTVLRMTVLK